MTATSVSVHSCSWTSELHGRLFRNGEPVINDVGLAALALLVAESDPKDKDVFIRLVMNMLAGNVVE